MDRGVAVVVAAVIGGMLASQAPLNAQLARTVGSVQAGVVALTVSFVAVALFALLTGNLGGIRRIGEAPLHVAVGGGLIGGLYVTSIVFTVRALGVGALTAVTIGAQLAIAMVIDHFGWLGLERSPLTATRLAGVALLAAGTYLVVRP